MSIAIDGARANGATALYSKATPEIGATIVDHLQRGELPAEHRCDDAAAFFALQERIVLSLYYFEELKLHEIATVLELTESRVSQIRSKALGKLRGELKPLRERVA